jgi:hypothetical protein
MKKNRLRKLQFPLNQKLTNNRLKISPEPPGLSGLLLILLPFVLFSCGIFPGIFSSKTGKTVSAMPAPDTGEQDPGKSPGGPEVQSGRDAILIRGNTMQTGIPGFGDNAFPALYGEYILELPGTREQGEAEEEPDFSVWVNQELLYLSQPPWKPRPGVPGFRVFEREWQNTRLFAAASDGREDSRGLSAGNVPEGPVRAPWTVIFQFSGSAGRTLGDEGLNRLIGLWLVRFSYFETLVHETVGLSLPAVVNF